VRVAYLVSRYPLISHVFILREVQALRRAGAAVDTFTIRRPDDDQLLSEDDRREHAATHAIVPPDPAELVGAHLRALRASPRRFLGTLRLALELRGLGARAALWQVFYFVEAVLLWNELRRRGIRHVHAHFANVGADVALLAANLGGPGWSWSFTMHGSTEFFDVREHRLPQKVERARFVACVSAHGRSQLMAHVGTEHWDKLRVVRCGVELSRFDPSEAGRDGRPPEILTVGRTVPVKGQSLLIDSVAELERRGLTARLTIVGDGPELPELRRRAERLGVADRVEFTGAVSQHDVPGYYERADVFALPSFAEGLPVVLIEALAMGIPVVASRITGIPELVEEGVSGLLVVPGQGDALTDALHDLLERSPEERREMGHAGRRRVAAEFDVDRSSRVLLDLFAEMVG
jgi:glycosyltransferase involved in cell wall biosynthesis